MLGLFVPYLAAKRAPTPRSSVMVTGRTTFVATATPPETAGWNFHCFTASITLSASEASGEDFTLNSETVPFAFTVNAISTLCPA